jgi:TolB-like protein
MKRCPQCNRVETDEALKFCRVDGATLINDSAALPSENGTLRLGSAPVSSEIETNILPTDANINRATSPTTVLASQIAGSTTAKLAKRNSKLGILIAVVALVVLALGVTGYFYFSKRTGAAISSIAVMPFVNESGDADVEYLSDGMTETLISSLSQLPGLNVKARSTVFRYKGKNTEVKTIGKDLGVQAVLNGRVVQRNDRLILSLELIDAQTENVIWSDKYDRKQTDLINLQNEIARDVSSRLRLKLTGADQQKLAKNYTVDPEVYKLYLQGRFYWNKRTDSEVDKAVTYFKQAVDRDPNFALGWVGLADSNEDQDRPTKMEYIRRALDIDDNLAEAHASLGYQYMCSQDWVNSEREYKRAMELNPNYAQTYAWNGARLMMLGKYDESLASIQRGLDLEPTANGINFYKAVCLAVSGRRDEAVLQFKRIQEMDPTFPWAHSFLARVYIWMGNREAAVEERAKALELNGRPEDAKLLRESFAKEGWDGFLRAGARQGREPFFKLALLSNANDADKEAMVKALTERSVERGGFWLFLVKTDPLYDPLRGDPRFQALLKKFNPPK